MGHHSSQYRHPFPTADMQICIKTDHGRYGLLHMDSLSEPSNDEPQVTATIWNW